MKKVLTVFILFILIFSFSSCTLGNSFKDIVYTMEIEAVYKGFMTGDNSEKTEDFWVVHCKRGLSTFNYYIILPEEPVDNISSIRTEKTGDKATFWIYDDKGEPKKVSDHGYKFKDWGD